MISAVDICYVRFQLSPLH